MTADADHPEKLFVHGGLVNLCYLGHKRWWLHNDSIDNSSTIDCGCETHDDCSNSRYQEAVAHIRWLDAAVRYGESTPASRLRRMK